MVIQQTDVTTVFESELLVAVGDCRTGNA